MFRGKKWKKDERTPEELKLMHSRRVKKGWQTRRAKRLRLFSVKRASDLPENNGA